MSSSRNLDFGNRRQRQRASTVSTRSDGRASFAAREDGVSFSSRNIYDVLDGDELSPSPTVGDPRFSTLATTGTFVGDLGGNDTSLFTTPPRPLSAQTGSGSGSGSREAFPNFSPEPSLLATPTRRGQWQTSTHSQDHNDISPGLAASRAAFPARAFRSTSGPETATNTFDYTRGLSPHTNPSMQNDSIASRDNVVSRSFEDPISPDRPVTDRWTRHSSIVGIDATFMLHPPISGEQTITSINEYLAVEEFAFRRGLTDRDAGRDRGFANPFPACFDRVWDEHWQRGWESTAAAHPEVRNDLSPSLPNSEWAPLVNPYSQDQEHPNGTFDIIWTHQMCQDALKAMKAIISRVLARGDGWRATVCDVPAAIAEALQQFPELLERYQQMVADGKEAVRGGRPSGY